jgi:hypothetical protein
MECWQNKARAKANVVDFFDTMVCFAQCRVFGKQFIFDQSHTTLALVYVFYNIYIYRYI